MRESLPLSYPVPAVFRCQAESLGLFAAKIKVERLSQVQLLPEGSRLPFKKIDPAHEPWRHQMAFGSKTSIFAMRRSPPLRNSRCAVKDTGASDLDETGRL
jgi:hypothetical protein